ERSVENWWVTSPLDPPRVRATPTAWGPTGTVATTARLAVAITERLSEAKLPTYTKAPSRLTVMPPPGLPRSILATTVWYVGLDESVSITVTSGELLAVI